MVQWVCTMSLSLHVNTFQSSVVSGHLGDKSGHMEQFDEAFNIIAYMANV